MQLQRVLARIPSEVAEPVPVQVECVYNIPLDVFFFFFFSPSSPHLLQLVRRMLQLDFCCEAPEMCCRLQNFT